MPIRDHLDTLKRGVEVWNEWRSSHVEVRPILSRAILGFSDLSRANLIGADHRDANLIGADLRDAHLNGAHLNGAHLVGASLFGANLRDANLISANLEGASLSSANLEGADFTKVSLGYTTFADNDLSKVKGLESVSHLGPTSIGVDSIYKSRGNIPEVFLRGCGVPDEFITYMRSLVAHPIQFYSCFISYSSKDHPFAERLHAGLQNKGVRCWFAPEDLKIGAEIRVGIDESIRLHDKLLLVLSETSVKSQWVQQEVETALEKEREQGRTVLFPIRLDDAVLEVNAGWPAYLRNTRNIGDFTRWKEHDSYSKAFDRLLRDLKAEEKKP